MHERTSSSCRRILLVDVERLRTGSGRWLNGREGNPDGFRMKVSLQAGRSYALSISGIIIGIAQWDPCMVLLACRPCLRWPLFSMRRPSQFCRFYSFSEDRKQLACDIDTDIEIDIDLDLATDFIVLFGDSAPVGRSPSYESLAPSHARTLATTTI